MKKLPKKERRIHKVYWLAPEFNKYLKKAAKEAGKSESRIIEELIYDNLC